jgi:PPOX class probable F420-dependent enzyme
MGEAQMADSFATKMSALMFRGMDKLRHRRAFEVGAMTPTGTDFTGSDKTRQIVLVTFKRSGEAMPSPINHGVADGKLYVRTDPSTGKVKRLRNNPNVVVVPCNLRGKPEGQAVAGVARIRPESEHAHAEEAIAANWSLPMKVFERSLDKGSQAFGIDIAYIEITPAPR